MNDRDQASGQTPKRDDASQQPQTGGPGKIDSRTEKAQEEAAKDRARQGGYQ
ncbi:hypothetical protein [Azospirillum picis]|uniref:Uncharacterized protein n=1 Tax=Azospirillum picis TaxID=488438 RepID=A0ABU0MFF3_9PROT|nr:hypothetical protein [Azospirillum picis]MBP2298783.1 hypothetical protein [Azospirillum picis]MDQ0532168.1 hypothetical protein [Azospirillum picis]